jgi:hypothetical protein
MENAFVKVFYAALYSFLSLFGIESSITICVKEKIYIEEKKKEEKHEHQKDVLIDEFEDVDLGS